jgi:hypothetical protein
MVVHIWSKVKDKKLMILKWWENNILMKAWEVDFQMVAMEKNTTKPLFILIVDIKDNVDIEVQFDHIKNISTIME